MLEVLFYGLLIVVALQFIFPLLQLLLVILSVIAELFKKITNRITNRNK